MNTFSPRLLLFLAVCCLATATGPAQTVSSPSPRHLFFRVTLGPQQTTAVSGRLLIFLRAGTALEDVVVSEFHPNSVYVAAKEVSYWKPGESVDVDTDNIAYPEGFSSLPAGDYVAQAVLDTGHNFAYYGRLPGDLESAPTALPHWTPGLSASAPGGMPRLILNSTIATPPAAEQRWPAEMSAVEKQAARASIHRLEFESPALSRFWGRPMHIRGWVVVPPGYAEHTKERYPTVYWTHGFGGTLERIRPAADMVYQRMAQGKMPPMIWVMLDESSPRGTHEFADSVNNGPWGTALTTEAIPALEREYRMDARPSGRFLNGHSSGGWATLWLQVTYPRIFGGTWSTSPDPSDFHDFTGVNLYAPHANMYRRPDGSPYPLVRDHGNVLATVQQLTQLEDVLGEYGGQMASFDWVFSPRGRDGRPEPMFNRATGEVDPTVVEYWRRHYDIAYLLQREWPTLGRDLRGRIHLMVGTADTFYLDGAAHRLDDVLYGLHADAHFSFLPNRTHMDLYRVGNDPRGLLDTIAAQMYAVARPKTHWQPKQ